MHSLYRLSNVGFYNRKRAILLATNLNYSRSCYLREQIRNFKIPISYNKIIPLYNFQSAFYHHSVNETHTQEKKDGKTKKKVKKEKEPKNKTETKNKTENFKFKESDVKRLQATNAAETLKENLNFNNVPNQMEFLNKSITSYISVCNFNEDEAEASRCFFYYAKEAKNNISVESCNEIIKCFATKGLFTYVLQVYDVMKYKELELDSNTFGYMLACLGHEVMSDKKVARNSKSLLQEMEKKGISIQDVILNTPFNRENLRRCLRVVRFSKPDLTDEEVIKMAKEKFVGDALHYKQDIMEQHSDLFNMEMSSPVEGVVSMEEMNGFVEEQIGIERKGFMSVQNIMQEGHKDKSIFAEWVNHWRKSILDSVSKKRVFVTANASSQYHGSLNIFPYLRLLTDEEITEFLLLEIVTLLQETSDSHSKSTRSIAFTLGHKFNEKFCLKYMHKSGFNDVYQDCYVKYCQYLANPNHPSVSHLSPVSRVRWTQIMTEKFLFGVNDTPVTWPNLVKSMLGQYLFTVLQKATFIWDPKSPDNLVPAFYKIYRMDNMKKIEQIKAHPIMLSVYGDGTVRDTIFETSTMPMLCPPLPWKDLNMGGYSLAKTYLIKVSSPGHIIPYHNEMASSLSNESLGQMYPVFDSVNLLGSVPWKINSEMLDILTGFFRRREGYPNLDIPACPNNGLTQTKPPTRRNNKDWYEWKVTQNAYLKQFKELHALRCEMTYKLSIANAMRDRVFWLPMNLDFRGRVYALPVHLTHITSDPFRSILKFAQGKPLGERGLYWLKIHLINLSGWKKRASLDDRLAYFDDCLPLIIDSADNPTTGDLWWMKGDHPWQTLSACKEVAAALRSENPEDFVSHLPIHQDGSCNGLQHYAALSRDERGGRSVNLLPSDYPQDVYSDILEEVVNKCRKDKERGNPLASLLIDGHFLTRKVVKQTVMTTVYGVTNYGARHQVLKQLKAISNFPKDSAHSASSYITKLIFSSLGTHFKNMFEIQTWLTNVALGMVLSCNEHVRWGTPLGLPVLQTYSTDDTKNGQVISSDQYARLDSVKNHDNKKMSAPSSMKHKNAFPPNYIHSLDSCHMMMTSIACLKQGMTFASIHDCFWTHGSTVDIMNKMCREQFICLHSEPLLQILAEQIRERTENNKNFSKAYKALNDKKVSLEDQLLAIPERGTLDINAVKESVFFFS